MESLRVERLDHCGLIACVIKDCGLLAMIDSQLVPDEQAAITPGEAVVGMIPTSLGCSHRPRSWRPQFFATTPLALLLQDGVEAERGNRFTLGRTLDEVQAYGGDLVLSELALAIYARAGIDQRFNHLDPTRFSRSGDSVPASETQAITVPHGYSRDHRQDLQQAVLALMASQDGGVPCVRKSGEGKASDTKIFQECAEGVLATLQASPTPR